MPASQIPLLPQRELTQAAPAQKQQRDSHADEDSFKQELNREIDRKREPEKSVQVEKKPEKTKQNQSYKDQVSEDVKDPQAVAAAIADNNATEVSADPEQGVKLIASESPSTQVPTETELSATTQTPETDTKPARVPEAEEAIAGQLSQQGGKDLPVDASAGAPEGKAGSSRNSTPVATSVAVSASVGKAAARQAAPSQSTPLSQFQQADNADAVDTPSADTPLLKAAQPEGESRRTQLFKLSADVDTSTLVQKPATQVSGVQHASAAYVHNTTAKPADAVLPQAATTTMQASIHSNVSSPQWQHSLGDQVSWMVSGKFHSAELKLHPAHLGPLEVKLHMHDDNKASVHFVSSHAVVRDAVDAAIPRLRELFEQQGLNLANVDVSAQGQQQQSMGGNGDSPGGNATAASSMQQDEGFSQTTTTVTTAVTQGLSIYA